MPRRDLHVITHTFGEDAQIVRQGVGVRNAQGIFLHGDPTITPVRLASAPLRTFETRLVDGQTRKELPEGVRLERARKFYIPVTGFDRVAPVRKGDAKTGPDVIRYRGTDYDVLSVIDYSEEGFVEALGVQPDARA